MSDGHDAAIGQALMKTRERRGISQADAADALGVSQVTIGNWEKGKTEPTGENRQELEEYLSEPPETVDNPPCDNCGATYVPMAITEIEAEDGSTVLICHWCKGRLTEDEVIVLAN